MEESWVVNKFELISFATADELTRAGVGDLQRVALTVWLQSSLRPPTNGVYCSGSDGTASD